MDQAQVYLLFHPIEKRSIGYNELLPPKHREFGRGYSPLDVDEGLADSKV